MGWGWGREVEGGGEEGAGMSEKGVQLRDVRWERRVLEAGRGRGVVGWLIWWGRGME